MEQTIEITISEIRHITRDTDQGIDSLDVDTINNAYNLGIDNTLKEIALHNINENLDYSEIQSNCVYHETWQKLEKANEQIHDELLQNVDEITEKSFIQGFILGYKMLKSIKER